MEVGEEPQREERAVRDQVGLVEHEHGVNVLTGERREIVLDRRVERRRHELALIAQEADGRPSGVRSLAGPPVALAQSASPVEPVP